ncbi:MAG: hypothetical protein ACJ76H_11530 [Bacteriovoracaceae bacterium]|jgi:hypothetical protein
MKYLIFAILVTTTSFASEIQSSNNGCDSYYRQRDQIYKEMSALSAEIVRSHSGSEEVQPSYSSSTNCEEGPTDYQVYLSRRRYLEQRLEDVNVSIRNYCPHGSPE